jgi:hypothetical protein
LADLSAVEKRVLKRWGNGRRKNLREHTHTLLEKEKSKRLSEFGEILVGALLPILICCMMHQHWGWTSDLFFVVSAILWILLILSDVLCIAL